ncbi:MAG: hypothetical protein ABIO44_05885 [Saprospiraceae bacterium]
MNKIIEWFIGSRQSREAEMREFAFANKKKFEITDSRGIVSQLSEFKLFKKGSHRNLRCIIFDNELLESNYLFDYEYKISNGKSTRRNIQTSKFFDSKLLALPQFFMRPEGFFTKLSEWFGIMDIDFLEDLQFSSNFLLSGEYESIIRLYFDEDVRKLINNNKGFYMEGMNYYLIIYIHKKVLKGQELASFEKLSILIYELFKLQSSKQEAFLLKK